MADTTDKETIRKVLETAVKQRRDSFETNVLHNQEKPSGYGLRNGSHVNVDPLLGLERKLKPVKDVAGKVIGECSVDIPPILMGKVKYECHAVEPGMDVSASSSRERYGFREANRSTVIMGTK